MAGDPGKNHRISTEGESLSDCLPCRNAATVMLAALARQGGDAVFDDPDPHLPDGRCRPGVR